MNIYEEIRKRETLIKTHKQSIITLEKQLLELNTQLVLYEDYALDISASCGRNI